MQTETFSTIRRQRLLGLTRIGYELNDDAIQIAVDLLPEDKNEDFVECSVCKFIQKSILGDECQNCGSQSQPIEIIN